MVYSVGKGDNLAATIKLKPREWYFVVYGDGQEDAAQKVIVGWAIDPQLSFTFADFAHLSAMVSPGLCKLPEYKPTDRG